MTARSKRLAGFNQVVLLIVGVLAAVHARPGFAFERSWEVHVRAVDQALARGDVSSAELAWHRAYAAALGTRRWEALLDVGDAVLRIGEAAKGRKAAERTASRVYLDGLFRARRQGSVDGTLRTAEAFAALGDREAVDRCLYIAEQLVQHTRDPQAQERVEALRVRWKAGSITAARQEWDPVLLLFPDESVGP